MVNNRYRLEGNSRADDVESGLQARIGDPLWMLARQWQVGEFRGEDASSPVQVRYQARTAALTGFRACDAGSFVRIDHRIPLEGYVERQEPGEWAGFHRSAEAGLHWLRMLSASELGQWRGEMRELFPLQTPDHVEPDEAARVGMLVRRACDGDAIYRGRRKLAALLQNQLNPDDAAAARRALDAWVGWYESRFLTPGDMNCWDPERMEYRFSVGAGTPAGSIELEASEYTGGHLDWFSFDLREGTADLPSRAGKHEPQTVLPAPVGFAGMAAPRWWEFEDGTVNFGDISAGPADFARMITAAFAATYGDDWYVVPVRVPIGSLAQMASVEVLDSFGDWQHIVPIAALDGPDRVWRFFELSGDGSDPLLFVPAVTLGRLEGGPVERVVLIRDEAENLGWGIESTYEGVLEKAVERRRQWAASRPADQPPEEDDLWEYRLLSAMPPHWIPFVPQRTGGTAQIRLRRGRMAEWELLPEDLVGIRGSILLPSPASPLLIHEEEVPGSGVEITSAYQFARDPSGAAYVWLGRRKRPAGKLTPISRQVDKVQRGTASESGE